MTESEMRSKLKEMMKDPANAAMMEGKDPDKMSAEEMQAMIDKMNSKTKSVSLSGAVESVEEAFGKLMNPPMDMPMMMPEVEEVFPDYIIACVEDKYFKIKYKTDKAGAIVFEPKEQWVEVEETYKPVVKNVLKAVSSSEDELRVANYIVLYGGRDLTAFRFLGNRIPRFTNPDGTAGEFFSKSVQLDSDYTELGKIPMNWEHGQDPDRMEIGEDEILGYVDWKTARIDDKGVFVERVLNRRKAYVQWVEELIKAGLVGTSSEAIGKGIEIKPNGEITKWPLKKDTLTVSPMEPRMLIGNVLNAYKALGLYKEVTPMQGVYSQDEAKRAGQEKPEAEPQPEIVIKSKGDNKMELEEAKLQEMLTQAAEAGATKAIAATEPVKSSGGTIQVTVDEGDRPFKTLAAQVQAVKDYTLSFGRKSHPRIDFLKAVQGASEGVPTDGGILLDPTLSPEVMKPIHQEGVFSADVRKLPVSNNSNSGWINGVDETDRATGSRWGGLRGYRLGEGDTVTKSKPKFRRINWELKKYGVLVYDTNELLKDAAQFSAIVEQGCREEIAFMLNDDIMNGLGGSGPLGVMNSPALITTTRVTTATIVGADVSTMWQRLSLTSKAKSKWYVNSECAPQLDALFAVGSTAVLFPYAGYTPDGVRTLYGRPIVETEFNAALNTTGDIMLADMSEYLLWEKGNVEMASSMHVEFLTDQEVVRFIYRCDGQPAAASPVTPYKGTLTHSPFVVIGSASA
jgi:HK97 family phage major capsid protein